MRRLPKRLGSTCGASSHDRAASLRRADIVKVALAGRAYDIVIGRGLLAGLGQRIAGFAAGRARRDRHGRDGCRASSGGGGGRAQGGRHRQRAYFVPAGEGSKAMPFRARLRSDLIAARIERNDLVVALGGGVIGDLAGFAAASARGAASILCRCRPRCWRRSIHRSAARPASIRVTARIWSAPSISRSW